MKSPNLVKKTNHNRPKGLNWLSKNYIKKKIQPTPNPTGQKGGWSKNIRETCSTTPHAHRTKQMTRSIIGIQPRHHRHTPTTGHTPHSAQNEAGEHTHATKVHWHTIEFSNNTSTPNTNPHTVSQHQVTLESASDCFPARHTNQRTSIRSPAGRCRSR